MHVLICFALINGRRGVFHAYQRLIAQVWEPPSLLVPCDFPKVSLHINALMHSANRAAVPVAPGVMHCRAGALWKAIEYSAAFSRCRRQAYYPFSHPFSRLPPSLSSVLVCKSVRDTRCPWIGFFFAVFIQSRYWPASPIAATIINYVLCETQAPAGKQPDVQCAGRWVSPACSLFLSLPPQVWKIAFIQPFNQKLTLPSCTAATDGGRAHLTSTKRSPQWSRRWDEGGVKDKREGEK